MLASVVVPTRDRAQLLPACLRTLLAQDLPDTDYEVVVVDDGSLDDTAAVAEQFAGNGPPVRVVRQPRLGLNAARNAGLREARAGLVCFIDDDELAPPHWLRTIVEAAARAPEAGCLGGPMRPAFEAVVPRTCGREPIDDSDFDLGATSRFVEHVYGGNMAVRRGAVDRVGPFREDLRMGGDELEWQHRLRAAGGSVLYVPEAWIDHRRPREALTWRALVTKRWTRGRNIALNAATVGRPLAARRVAASLRRSLIHAVRARCAGGLLHAVQHAGRLAGLAEARVRR